MTDTKKVRQQARKIIGQSGLDRLAEHDAALVHHAESLQRLIDWRDDHLTKVAKHAAQVDAHFDDALADVTRLTEPLWRGFWGRLRWLLTGK